MELYFVLDIFKQNTYCVILFSQKLITSYSLVQVLDPANYINIPSFIETDPG